jgi:Conserved membrane protein (DUF2044).
VNFFFGPKSWVLISHRFPNIISWYFRKDYNTNRLKSGLLQLSSSTYLILDEIHLQPGQLNNTGCLNVKALSSVVNNQRMSYDFQFYDGTFPTDIPVLSLSDTKSMLPVSVKYCDRIE